MNYNWPTYTPAISEMKDARRVTIMVTDWIWSRALTAIRGESGTGLFMVIEKNVHDRVRSNVCITITATGYK